VEVRYEYCLFTSDSSWYGYPHHRPWVNYLGAKEGNNYYDSLINGFDLREFFSRWPPRPEPGALITGGWIAIAVGIVTAGIGGLLWWLNR